ncbi:hypothetical protein INT45_004351 [Circinella minor]|uniref:Uncharacterized protein n=1 Tax=Circinella minor TaxID=1195481 RepID=A0A8H7SAC9_9FUNG|nr:hypothetical protein INT45_004351 [Circinella minor]
MARQSNTHHIKRFSTKALRPNTRFIITTLNLKNSEVSASYYVQRTIQQRQTSKYIAQLQHLATSENHTAPEGMQTEALAFYQSLYTTYEVDDPSINPMLNSLPPSASLDPDNAESLVCDFHLDELRDVTKRSSKQSNPRDDRLPHLIINKRIRVSQQLTTPFRTDFLPNRFIADNELLVGFVMEQTNHQRHHDTIGLC